MTTSVDTKPRAQRVDSQAETAPATPVATRALSLIHISEPTRP